MNSRDEMKNLDRAVRRVLIIIGVPMLCLAWHYYGYVFSAFHG